MKTNIKNTILATSIIAAIARPFAEAAVAEPPKEEEAPPITVDMLGTPSVAETATIRLRDLITDQDTQNRVTIDAATVEHYSEVIKEAKKAQQPIPLPPLRAVRSPEGKLYLWDGFHRRDALKAAHEGEYEVEIYVAPEKVDPIFYAQALALTANAAHGKPRTNKDRERVAKLAIRQFPTATNMDLARWTGVSEGTIRNYRGAATSPAVRVATRKGKTVKINTSRIGKKGGKKPKVKKEGKKAKGKKDDTSTASKNGDAGPDTVLLTALKKIGDAIEPATFAGQVRKGLESGSLDVSRGEVIAWAGYSKEKITQVARLVVDNQMKPSRALAFLDKELAGNTNLDTIAILLHAGIKRSEEVAGLKIKFDGEGTLEIKLAKK